MSATRKYSSPMRQQQAEQTRRRIARAAHHILLSKGYAGMTVAATAKRAGVSAQTVYAVFGSKRGILAEILDQTTFGPEYEQLVAEVRKTTDPYERLQRVARIARTVHESGRGVTDLFRGAGVVAPELAAIENDRECRRFESQAPNANVLEASGKLRPGVSPERAHEVMWMLTSRDVFRMLVRERGWTADEYETWLGDALVRTLLK